MNRLPDEEHALLYQDLITKLGNMGFNPGNAAGRAYTGYSFANASMNTALDKKETRISITERQGCLGGLIHILLCDEGVEWQGTLDFTDPFSWKIEVYGDHNIPHLRHVAQRLEEAYKSTVNVELASHSIRREAGTQELAEDD